jgi:hypothetical protein
MTPQAEPQVGSELYSADEIRPYINALIYSDPGVGKTSLVASAAENPAMGEVLFLNFEGGLLSIKGRKNVRIRDVHSVDDVEDAFWAVIQKRPGYEKIGTVAIDSGTELQGVNLEQLASEAFNDKSKRGKRESVDQIFQEDYGKDTARLKRVFRWFRDAPFNFIITAHAKRLYKKGQDKNSDPTLIGVQPAFTNKLGVSVCGYVDFVWYMFKENEDENGQPVPERRYLLPQERGVYYAKTRGHKFAAALGDKVLINEGDKQHMNLAKMYDLLLKSEGITLKK